MNMSVQVTLLIQAGNNPNDLHGTVNLTLPPGEAKAVTYGDLRNSFLSGMKLIPLPYDPTDTYYGRVMARGDWMDIWLNNSNSIELTTELMQNIVSSRPCKQTSYRSVTTRPL